MLLGIGTRNHLSRLWSDHVMFSGMFFYDISFSTLAQLHLSVQTLELPYYVVGT